MQATLRTIRPSSQSALARHNELWARRKLNPARLVARQIALSDVTDTRPRMARVETVGFEVITRFT